MWVIESRRRPRAGQQFVEPLDGMLCDARQNVGEPGLRIDIVHLGGDDQAVHRRGTVATTV